MLFISLMALQPPPLVVLCLSMLLCMCACVCMSVETGSRCWVSLNHSLPYFLRQGFPLNPVLPSLTKLTGSQAPWIPLLLVQHGDYGHVPTALSCFMSGLGIELRNPCLYSKHFAAKPSPQCQSCCIFEPPKAPDFSFHLERLDYLVRNFLKWEGLPRNGIYARRQTEKSHSFQRSSGTAHTSASRCLCRPLHRNVSTLKAGTELGDLARHCLASTDPECVRVCSCRHT